MLCPFCKREDLPSAPGFPPRARITVAHVKPDNEPCKIGSPSDTYDTEILTLIVGDDALWDPEFSTGQPADGIQAAAGGNASPRTDGASSVPPEGSIPSPVTIAGPSRVGSPIVRENDKGDFLIEGLVGAPVQLTAPSAIPTAFEPEPPKKPDRRADTRRRTPPKATRKPERATDGNDDEDIDGWDP